MKVTRVTSSLADPAPRNPMIQRGVPEVTVRRRTVGGMCGRLRACTCWPCHGEWAVQLQMIGTAADLIDAGEPPVARRLHSVLSTRIPEARVAPPLIRSTGLAIAEDSDVP
jgi:hypothetical protein